MAEYSNLSSSLHTFNAPLVPDYSICKKDGDSFKFSTLEELNKCLEERGYKDLALSTKTTLARAIPKEQLIKGDINEFSKSTQEVIKKYKTLEDYLCIMYPYLTETERQERQERIEKERIAKEQETQKARRMAIAESKKYANLPFNQKDKRFANIIIDDDNRKVVQAMDRYIFNASPNKQQIGFFLHGKPGTGKTTLLCAFANEIIENSLYGNASVYFQNGVSLVSDVINSKDLMWKLTNTGTLIIDDITQNIGKDFYVQTLFDIIDKRLNANLLTCITSNISIDKMIDVWKTKTTEVDRLEALRSRLKATTVEVEIKGQDRRQNYTIDDLLGRDF